MGEDAGAPAERDPIEPPDFWRDCHVDDEQQHDHRHIGEGVDREAARVRVEKDALAAAGMRQPEGERVRGDADPPACRDPDEPQPVGAKPQIHGGADGHGHQIGGEVGKKRERAGIPRHGGKQSTDALLLCGLQ